MLVTEQAIMKLLVTINRVITVPDSRDSRSAPLAKRCRHCAAVHPAKALARIKIPGFVAGGQVG